MIPNLAVNVATQIHVGDPDHTGAIQRAVNLVLEAGGGTVYFPKLCNDGAIGTYFASSNIYLNGANPPGSPYFTEPLTASAAKPIIRFVGDGIGQSVIMATASAMRLFYAPEDAGWTVFEFSDLTITAATTTNSVTGISIAGTAAASPVVNVSIDHVQFLNMPNSTGISLSYCTQNFISNVLLEAVDCGIFLYESGQTAITNTMIVLGNGPGIQNNATPSDHLGEGMFLNNVNVNGQRIGLLIQDQNWGSVTGSAFTTCRDGAVIVAQSAPDGYTANWQFSACQFSTGNSAALPYAVTADGSASNLQFQACQIAISYGGIYFGSPDGSGAWNAWHMITGCNFSNNGYADVTLEGTNACNISGNLCNSRGSSGSSIMEIGTANLNNLVGNSVRKPITLIGAQSQQASNLSLE